MRLLDKKINFLCDYGYVYLTASQKKEIEKEYNFKLIEGNAKYLLPKNQKCYKVDKSEQK